MIDLRKLFGFAWQPDIELANDEWTAGPRIRAQAGDLEMEPASGLIDFRPRQRWTAQRPRKPGYFWCRTEGTARIVELYVEFGGRWRMAGIGWGPINVPDEGLEWGSLQISEPAA